MPETPYGGVAPSASRGEVGGPRHYDGPTLGQLVSWKCPACAVENTGPLDAGCTACGAGSVRPRHVGVPPRADRPPVLIPTIRITPPIDDAVVAAFETWLDTRVSQDANPAGVARLRNILFDAWMDAIRWYQSAGRTSADTAVDPADTETPASNDHIPIPKALVRRVIATLEATTDLPDEQQSPELLALISELKERLE